MKTLIASLSLILSINLFAQSNISAEKADMIAQAIVDCDSSLIIENQATKHTLEFFQERALDILEMLTQAETSNDFSAVSREANNVWPLIHSSENNYQVLREIILELRNIAHEQYLDLLDKL